MDIKEIAKKYSIKEVFEFEEGTEFVDLKTGVIFELQTGREGYADNMKMLINTECDGVVPLSNRIFDMEFTKRKHAVTFEEVLNSDKRCRVEHELINRSLYKKIGSDDETTINDYEKFKCGKYMELQDLLAVLPWILSNQEFKEIIKNGKWYLEEE